MIITIVAVTASCVASAAQASAAVGAVGRFLAPADTFMRQYQNAANAVSREGFRAVSARRPAAIVTRFHGEMALHLQQEMGTEAPLDRQSEIKGAQYQLPDSAQDGRTVMLGIGAGLGLAYLVFLACWVWATRLRPGRG